MFRPILCLLTILTPLSATDPQSFDIVANFFSDSGPARFYRVLDVRPDGPDSVLTWIRVAPRGEVCRNIIVQSVEWRIPG